MSRCLVLLFVAGAFLAATCVPVAAAAEPLVLERADAQGFKARPVSPAAALRALAAALSPARLPSTGPVRQAASRFTRTGTELWSLALVYRNGDTAGRELGKLLRAVSAGRIGSVAAPVGELGRLLLSRGGAVVVWRRGPALGAIVLSRTGSGQRALSKLAVSYARLGDAHLARTVAASAWDRALSEISPTGKVPRSAALKLFALAYVPISGARRPAGPRGEPEGTLAARAVLGVWATLSGAERAAAMRALGVTSVSLGRASSRVSHGDAVHAGSIYGDDKFVLNAEYQKIADGWRTAYEARLGTALKGRLVVGTSPGALNGFADALPIDEGGILSAKTTACRIRIAPGAVGKGPTQVQFTLAHEVFHCFQYSLTGSNAGVTEEPWLAEGTADWAAFSVDPNFNGSSSMRDYLQNCRVMLFARSHSSVGFFGHVEDSTGSLWPRLGAILRAPDRLSSYAAAGGAWAVMLDSWGSSVARPPNFGLNWTVQSPIVPPAGISCAPVPLAPGQVVADPFNVELYAVGSVGADAKRPIMHVTIQGHARISDGTVDSAALGDAYFCLVDCKCPPDQEGSPPATVKLSPSAYLGVTGGRKGASGTVALEPLDQYCKKKEKKPKRPGGPPVGGGGGGGGRCSAAVDGATCGVGCATGCGSSNGDPHLTTLDGRFYDFQAAGEYTLVRSKVDGLEIQAREEPYPYSTTLSVNTAVALRVGADRIGVYHGEPLAVRLNGLGFLPGQRPQKLRGGGTVRLVAGQVEVTWPDGTLARVFSVGTWGVAVIVKPVTARQNTLTGLLGNFDGNEKNDFATRTGRTLDLERTLGSRRLLYGVFGESWRIAQKNSLFDYARGQSTRTFTNRRFPAEIVTVNSLSPRARRRAERICRSLKITIREVLEACIVDVAATGDGSFATAGAQLQRAAVRFGLPTAAGTPDARWAPLATGGRSNAIVPSVAVDGTRVVVASVVDSKAAEAVTFTPSAASDVSGLRRDEITSGWNFLDDPVLLARPEGGLQALLSGIDGQLQAGTWLAPRNPDGTFGAPVVASDQTSDVGGAAVLAPDGSPLWASAASSTLTIWHGTAGAAGADLSGLLRGTPYVPSVGRDGLGRYWLAWYLLGASGGPATGLYVVQIDPATLQPLGTPQRAPRSQTSANNSLRLAFACAQTCRLVYIQERGLRDSIVSWAPGERTAALVVKARPNPWLAAAYSASGRLWVAWYDAGVRRYRVVLGNAQGGGGMPRTVGRPLSVGGGFGIAAVSTGTGFVLVTNWQAGNSAFTRFVNVVPPG